MNLVLVQRSFRRFVESSRLPPRRVQKRIALAGCVVLLMFIYMFFLPFSPDSKASRSRCVADQLSKGSLLGLHEAFAPSPTSFVGNGFVGMDVAADEQLLVARANDTSLKAPIYTAFRPLVDVSLTTVETIDKFQYVLDFHQGVSRAVRCASFSDKCFCIQQSVYAHRTRRNLIVQEIRISNPTTSFIEILFKRKGNSDWKQRLGGSLPAMHTKIFVESKAIVGVICSSVPLSTLSIKAQTEETFRFLCIVERSLMSNNGENVLINKLSEQFTQLNTLNSNVLDTEHFEAWEKLNAPAFEIDYSKAPNALNSYQINVTRHGLLSVVPSPILELGTDSQRLNVLLQALSRTELCYSGHSTLLKPSKLWQDWANVQELLQTMEIWLLTLEHNGCMHLLESGANGLAHAFLLSLLAATFTQHRLEIALDPESDLHRQIHVRNLRVGVTNLGIFFNLEAASYKPFVEVQILGDTTGTGLTFTSVASSSVNLYACGAGCREMPIIISRNRPTRLALKITKPPTPILFIAENREHLLRIKDTLHVSEVLDAPAAELHKVELHKNGENTGLPTIFWVILIVTLVAFHLFLLRLLYSEWQNSSSVPYTRLSKRFLLNS